MSSNRANELMEQAMIAFDRAGAPPDLQPLGMASLNDPEASGLFLVAIERFCSQIDSPERARDAQIGLALATNAALERKAALTSDSNVSRRSSGALLSYLQNSGSEG